MNNGKHTPGPWEVVGIRRKGPFFGPQGRPFPVTAISTNHPHGPWESIYCKDRDSADLIASAPDLLEVCEGIIAGKIALYNAQSAAYQIPPFEEWAPGLRTMLAAIAKAKGATP